MFVKIKNEILDVKQIKRITQDVDNVYETTKEYDDYLKSQHSFLGFFVGNRYTDKLIKTVYKIYIETYDLDTLEYEYESEDDFNDNIILLEKSLLKGE